MSAVSVKYPPVSEELLRVLVRKLRTAGSPQKIVLFGSQARGEAREDSDLDILIIEESDIPRYKRAAKYHVALLGLFPSKDIVVWTPAEVADWAQVPNAFITAILAEGRLLFEEQD